MISDLSSLDRNSPSFLVIRWTIFVHSSIAFPTPHGLRTYRTRDLVSEIVLQRICRKGGYIGRCERISDDDLMDFLHSMAILVWSLQHDVSFRDFGLFKITRV